MTLGGRIVSLFPTFYLICVLGWITKMFMGFEVYDLLILLGIIYLMPLIVFRIHHLFFPFSDGYWVLSERKYNPWWASHMFQFPFIACPWLESFFHFIPGLYSLWLRAWGSKVGKGVFWTPRVEIIDRNLVEIGDYCVFGHLTTMCSHMVADIEGKPSLVVKTIKIGSKSFIGADSQFGPGAIIPEKTKVKVKTRMYWRGEWK